VSDGHGPTRFYRLRLSPSGHPGRLTPLPIAALMQPLTGLALSRDGRQLAVSLFPPGRFNTGARIKIWSTATGAERDWLWPGAGIIYSPGTIFSQYTARSLSWTADGSRLLFHVTPGVGGAQARLLDATSPGGNLRAASQRIPIPSNELSNRGPIPPFNIIEPLLITGDGTRVVGPTARPLPRKPGKPGHPAPMLEDTISEFPVQAGPPVRVPYRQKFGYDTDPAVFWVNQTGSVMIILRPAAKFTRGGTGLLGVLTPDGFTPFPAAVQRTFAHDQPGW